MASEYSPFTPGIPVSPELFVGRSDEVEELAGYAADAANGRFRVAFLTGERGIGKSSIATYVRAIAEYRHNMLTVQSFLAKASSVEDAVRSVFDRLLKDSREEGWYDEVAELFKNYVSEVGLFGASLSFSPPPDDLKRLTHSFDSALATVHAKVSHQSQGIVLVLDDINGLATSQEFANWLKSFIDTVATAKKTLPLFMLLVGLEQRRRELIEGHPSLARAFSVVDIRQWSHEEACEFFDRSFESVNMSVDDDARDFMARYTGGLPVLGHEIGEATFRAAGDDVVDFDAAAEGVFTAASIVGLKHIQPTVLEAIRSAKYRSILRKLSAGEMVFKRSEVLKELGAAEKGVLDNFLGKMRDLGVLERVPDRGPGYWRFTSLLHRLYFALQAQLEEQRS